MPAFDPCVLPADFRKAHWDKFTSAEQKRWLALRQRGLTDHLFLATEVLGMDFQKNPHEILFKHFLRKNPDKPLYDLDTVKKRMILWPRGTFKTSSIIVEIVQLILSYPDIRICILSGSQTLTKRQLARVKRFFEKPPEKFLYLYPDYCGKKLGTTEEFTVPNRTKDFFAEPTVAISTANSVKAGSHFDVIFVDDLVNDQNYRSPSALEKCTDDYKDIGPLLEPAGFLYVTGTRYSFGDTYEYIQERAKEEIEETGKTVWKFSIRTCWIKYCATCGHPDINHDSDKHYSKPPCTICACTCFVDSGKKDVLFPEARTRDGRTIGHTVEFLQRERREKGDEFFACQYENNPIAAGTQQFTPELLDAQTLYHLKQIPQHGPIFFVGDLSYVGSDDRDKSVIYVCRLVQGQIFVFDCISGKWGTEDVTKQLFSAIMRYRPNVIYLERFMGWEAYETVFRMFCQQNNIQRFPVQWLQMNQTRGAKQIRIASIQGVLAQKRIWLFAGMPEFDMLCAQLKKFPKQGKHDDYADCLGLVCQAPTGYHLTAIPQESKIPEFLRKAKQEAESHYYDNGAGSGICC